MILNKSGRGTLSGLGRIDGWCIKDVEGIPEVIACQAVKTANSGYLLEKDGMFVPVTLAKDFFVHEFSALVVLRGLLEEALTGAMERVGDIGGRMDAICERICAIRGGMVIAGCECREEGTGGKESNT